jgi:hypothetical protein
VVLAAGGGALHVEEDRGLVELMHRGRRRAHPLEGIVHLGDVMVAGVEAREWRGGREC